MAAADAFQSYKLRGISRYVSRYGPPYRGIPRYGNSSRYPPLLGTDPVIPLVGRLAPEVLNAINKVLPQSTKSISIVPLSNRFAVLSSLSEDTPVLITSSHLGTDSRDALHTVDRHHLSRDTPSDRATAPASSDPLSVSVNTDSDLQNHFAKLTIRLDESNNHTVKFQEDATTPKLVLAPAAAVMWRQSQSSLQTSMKAGVRSEWLSNLCQSDIATPWVAGLHPLPPYCQEDQVLCKTIVNIRKKAALEIQQCTAAYLKDPAMHGSLPERERYQGKGNQYHPANCGREGIQGQSHCPG